MSVPDYGPQPTWHPVDLSGDIDDIQPPSILTRADGVSLIYQGRVHWLQGESESHKSWIALIAVTQVLVDRGGNVLYVDYEDHPNTIKSRLRALGVHRDILGDQSRFVYVRPDEPLDDDYNWPILNGVLANLSPELAVIDGVSESMAIEELDPNSSTDVATWIMKLPRTIGASAGGPAIIVIDHQTKSTEGRKGWAIGSQHKRAGVDGAAYDVQAIRKLTPAYYGEPISGLVTMTIAKDRIGYVRGHSPGDNAATIELTAEPDGGVTWQITTNAMARDFGLRKRIAEYLTNAPGASKRSIRDVGGKGTDLDQTLAGMIGDSEVRMEPKGQAHCHFLTDDGREKYLEVSE